MYRLYLDEVGTDDLVHLEKDSHRYLSLTGVAIELQHVGDVLNPFIRDLKQSVFEIDPDEKVHLHRYDIVGKKGVFGQLRDANKLARFNAGITSLINDTEYTVITAVVDKLAMSRMDHWSTVHPYHYLMEILVEKYAQFLERKNSIGDIMPEARRGRKDKDLQLEFERVKEAGTTYISSERIESVIRANKLKFRTKDHNISGLQLCDLIAHPSHMHIRNIHGHPVKLGEFAIKVRDTLERSKYDRSYRGKINGYGIKTVPTKMEP
ncbi:MAG: DUF3800 domain-containing protein [Rhodobacteraceae bacterium]|nr:DUF3800 domain-containing protein [Paracoccaceae bacterium]